MLFLFLIILLIYALNAFYNGKRTISVLILIGFMTNLYQVLPDEMLLNYPLKKVNDFAILYIAALAFFQFIHGKISFFKIRDKEISWVKWYILYLTFNFTYTILTNKEEFGYSFITFRNFIPIWSFLVIKELTCRELKKVIQILYKITIFQCILFCLQPLLHVQLLVGFFSDNFSGDGFHRYRNIPLLCYFFTIYTVVAPNYKGWKQIAIILLMLLSIFLTGHRGIMLSFAMGGIIYLLIKRNFKLYIRVALFLILGSFIFMPMLTARFTEVNILEDIATGVSSKTSVEDMESGQTFTFRMLLLQERAQYLADHPKFLLTGVGMRHEDSPRTDREFNFRIGSNKPGSNGVWIPQQLDTGDLAWGTPLIKYGWLAIILLVVIIVKFMCFFYKNKQLNISLAALLYYLIMFFASLKNDMVISPLTFAILFLCYYTTKIKTYENSNSYIFQRT